MTMKLNVVYLDYAIRILKQHCQENVAVPR